jgi:acetyltransferase-like isoleucine patch superfamily enzyme
MNERPLVDELGDERTSPYRRYLRMFVGEESLGALMRFEVLTGALGALPGALGYFLRSKAYRWLFKRIGKGSVIGRSVVLRCPGRISIGTHVMIDDYVVLDAKGASSAVELGNRILVGRNTILSCHEARIRVGDFVSIGPFCFFASKSHIEIGSHVSIGSGSHLMAGGHAFTDPSTPIILQARISKGIVVEDGAWIGSGTKVLDGVTIGKNSIVGAGAVVTESIPPNVIAVGVPAKILRSRGDR